MTRHSTRPPLERAHLLSELIKNLKLVWRLLRDHRVSPWLKAVIPATVAAYLLSPVDLAPDIFPILGQLDDLVIALLGIKLFIDLCPPTIVEEHLQNMSGRSRQQPSSDHSYIEVPYRVLNDRERT